MDKSIRTQVEIRSPQQAEASSWNKVRVYGYSPGMVALQLRGFRGSIGTYAHATLSVDEAKELIKFLQSAVREVRIQTVEELAGL